MPHNDVGSSGAHETVPPHYCRNANYASQETGKSWTIPHRSICMLTADIQINISKTCSITLLSILTARSILVSRRQLHISIHTGAVIDAVLGTLKRIGDAAIPTADIEDAAENATGSTLDNVLQDRLSDIVDFK